MADVVLTPEQRAELEQVCTEGLEVYACLQRSQDALDFYQAQVPLYEQSVMERKLAIQQFEIKLRKLGLGLHDLGHARTLLAKP